MNLESTFSLEELVSAYSALSSRCLSQSSAWVLEYILATNESPTIETDSFDARYLLAQNLFRMGEFSKAAFILEKSTDQQSIGLKFLSKFIDTQRQIDQAINDSATFLGNLPVTSTSNFNAYDSLVQEIEPYVESFDSLNLYIYSAILFKNGKYQEALTYLIKSLQDFPLNRSAYRLLLSILLRNDDHVIAPTLENLPRHWTTVLFRIELLAEMQQTEAAIRLFSQVKLPRTSSLIALEATIHYHHRDFDRSQSLFEELRRVDPLRLEGLELYSNLLFVKEDVAGLSQLAQSTVLIDKFRPETLTVSGNFFAINGRHEDAISQFAMALRFDSSFNFAWTLIGHEFVELDNISAAIAAYTKATEANPRDFRALYGLGRAYELSKMPYHAILYYRNAVTMNPFDSRMWMALGECYEELGEKENAIKCYQRAVCNIDSDGIAIYRLAKLYKEENDDDRAAFCYESYIEKYVSDEEGTKKDEAKEAIQFLANYFRAKHNTEKVEFYAQKLMLDPSAVAEGNALLKDIRTERK